MKGLLGGCECSRLIKNTELSCPLWVSESHAYRAIFCGLAYSFCVLWTLGRTFQKEAFLGFQLQLGPSSDIYSAVLASLLNCFCYRCCSLDVCVVHGDWLSPSHPPIPDMPLNTPSASCRLNLHRCGEPMSILAGGGGFSKPLCRSNLPAL